jgi:hypothetical protein
MSALSQLRQWQNAAKRRRLLMAAIIGLPLIFAVFLLAQRFLSIPLAITITLASIAVLGFFAWRSVQIFDNAWLIRQLDLREGNLEDSSDLLFKPVPELSTLQNLQRERIEQRVLDLTKIDLREQWPIKIIVLSFSAALILGLTAMFFPQEKLRDGVAVVTPANAKSASNVPVLLINQQIVIRAPAYTGLSARSEKNLQVKFPEGSTLSWNLQFQPQPALVKAGRPPALFCNRVCIAYKLTSGHYRKTNFIVSMPSRIYRRNYGLFSRIEI